MNDNSSNSPVWLTRKQAGEYLQVSPGTIDRMVRLGELPRYKLGPERNASVRFRIEDLHALMHYEGQHEEAQA